MAMRCPPSQLARDPRRDRVVITRLETRRGQYLTDDALFPSCRHKDPVAMIGSRLVGGFVSGPPQGLRQRPSGVGRGPAGNHAEACKALQGLPLLRRGLEGLVLPAFPERAKI